MIATDVKHIVRYMGLGGNLDAAIDWIAAGGWEKLPEGKLEIAGDRVYAIVQRYNSKAIENCRFETHRNYIDIQMLVSGAELMEVRPAEGLKVTEPYKPDVEFYANPASANPAAESSHEILLTAGAAAILFPEDAHRPCIAVDGKPEAVHKIVLKVAIS